MGDQTVKIYKPTINERTVTYRYNNKDITVEFPTKNTGGFSNTRANIGLSIAKAFNEYAFKDKDVNKGNIQRKDAIKILQNVFKENSGLYTEETAYGKQQLYVNDGLGTTLFPARIGVKAEITVFTLRHDG